ncbi:MAG: 2-polyprenyl-3-methyl-5-hydroxy-6-metoxy-1,4-benzoquinol methylase [Oceanicoccus sp.]|jgi:2-polyprenyl-3-methyl-5-hydroxy-6-metoxy-1,4-benzoquinol methylase
MKIKKSKIESYSPINLIKTIPTRAKVSLANINSKKEYRGVTSNLCLEKLIKDFEFHTVLDVGSGKGDHAKIFTKNNKAVTTIDLGTSKYYQEIKDTNIAINHINTDFNNYVTEIKFDLCWCSHILEHQNNIGLFLEKVKSVTKNGGIIAITVPPFKHNLVGGHLSIWNAAILTYNLVMAGIDCKDAKLLKYGYNISIIARNTHFELPADLDYDIGDLERLKDRFPFDAKQNTPGDIIEKNWFSR